MMIHSLKLPIMIYEVIQKYNEDTLSEILR